MISKNAALMGAANAATRLGVSRNTITRHLSTVRIGGRVMVRVADVEVLIQEGRTNAA